MVLIVLTVGVLSFTTRRESFKREKYLTSYLGDAKLLEDSKRDSYHLFYLVQVGYCGNCNRSVIDFVKENAPSKLEPIVLLTSDNADALMLADKLSPIECHLGDSGTVDKYGLVSTANYVFIYQGVELVWWKEFNSENRNEISNNIRKYVNSDKGQFSLKGI